MWDCIQEFRCKHPIRPPAFHFQHPQSHVIHVSPRVQSFTPSTTQVTVLFTGMGVVERLSKHKHRWCSHQPVKIKSLRFSFLSRRGRSASCTALGGCSNLCIGLWGHRRRLGLCFGLALRAGFCRRFHFRFGFGTCGLLTLRNQWPGKGPNQEQTDAKD